MNISARVTLAGLLVLAVSLTSCQSEQPAIIRVMTYNIHHGEGTDGALDLGRIARVIRDTEADLVALQEVDRGVARTGGVDQPAALAELTGLRAIFEKNIDYQGGEYGNAVLSHLPVEWHENHLLPQSLPNEQRGLLEVHVRVAGRKLIFCATHFDYHPDDTERLESVARLRELVAQRKDLPVILAGDLNAAPDSRVITAVDRFLSDCFAGVKQVGFTYPAGEPVRRIDYILYTQGRNLRCLDRRVIPEPLASDHRPLLAVFALDPD